MNPKKKPQPPKYTPKNDDPAEPPYRNHPENLGDFWLDKILFGFFVGVVLIVVAVLAHLFGWQ